MQKIKSKAMAILIAAILTLSMTASMTLIPTTSAHTPPWNIPTIAYCNVAPNPIGLGQSVNLGFWICQPPPTASGIFGDRWANMTVKVTKPDGTSQTLGPYTSDDTGGTHDTFTPAAIGNYSFQMSFPGQTLAGANPPSTGFSAGVAAFIGDYFEPSTSNIATLTVQNQPVGGVSVAPLPKDYWQTPINAMNVNNWYAIGGPSLALGSQGSLSPPSALGKYNFTSNFNPYTTAPTTAHIMWTKPEAFGGALGGQYGGTTTYGNYYSIKQNEREFNPVIINGYLYYNEYPGSSTTPTSLICKSLYTGQTVWTDDASNLGGGNPSQSALTSTGVVTNIRCGQVLDFVGPNQYGGLAYIWTYGTPIGINATAGTTTYNMFDAKTGTYILSIVNGTGLSALTEDNSGNLIGYYVNATAGTQMVMGPINGLIGPKPTATTSTGPTLNMWNSTLCIQASAWGSQGAGWSWRPPQNGIISFSNGLQWSKPLATNYSDNALPSAFGIYTIDNGVIVVDSLLSSAGTTGYVFVMGYGIFAGYSTTTGQQLWIENITIQSGTTASLMCASLAGDGLWFISNEQLGTLTAYSVTTGSQVWTDTFSNANPYDSIGGYAGAIANNTLYLMAFGGDIWSINLANGKINWYTNTATLLGPAGTDSPYGVWPLWTFSGSTVADGILFLEEGHEYSPPLFLGAQQLAINCTTGQLVWKIHAFDVDACPAIAYGIMTVINAYDNQIYAYGMGPSKTTAAAPNVGVTTSTPITITGSVTDISAGSQQEAVAANFPNGLPAVSDASQSQFMESVYMQQPMPTNATGVPVTLSVIDSNGNYRQIGTTTTNAMGTYGFTWTPDITGNYTVIATFAGSGSYYGSSAQTYFYASSPPATPAPTATPATSVADTYFVPAIAGLFVLIIIVLALVILGMLRKRP